MSVSSMPGFTFISRLWSSPSAPPTDTFSEDVKQLALSSVAKVMGKGVDLGCGVLIGIDRLIVPLHVISTHCPEELSIQFSKTDTQQSVCFAVLQILVTDPDLDCAILQLGTVAGGAFPGNLFCFPDISCREHKGPFLLSSFDHGVPVLQCGEGKPCSDVHFCSEVMTVPGCSGGGYIDREGKLFAIHLSRSTGACDPFNSRERRALYLKDVVSKHPKIFNIPICRPICPPEFVTPCAPVFISLDPCFAEERRPIMGCIGDKYQYCEWRPRNGGGPGPRGVTIGIKGVRGMITYKFAPNPHDYAAYNKRQDKLYEEATRQFIREYERVQQVPGSFVFQAYNVEFTATLE